MTDPGTSKFTNTVTTLSSALRNSKFCSLLSFKRRNRIRRILTLTAFRRIKACMERYNNGAYDRIQFLRAFSHSLGAHTEAFHVTPDNDSDSEFLTLSCSLSHVIALAYLSTFNKYERYYGPGRWRHLVKNLRR